MNVGTVIAQRLHRWIWPQREERLKAVLLYTLVTLLVSAAILLTGVRLVFAAAPALTAPVGALVSDQLGVPVAIGGLDARLDRLRPGLVLRDVRVGDADETRPLALSTMTLAIAPWRSLRAGELRLHALSAEGLDVTLRQQPSGNWRIAGLLPGASPIAPESFLEALQGLPVDRLLIRDSRLSLVDRNDEARPGFESVALRWRREPGGQWRFALDARQGDERVQGRMRLDSSEMSSARAVVDLEGLSGKRIGPWLPAGAMRPDGAATLSGRLWISLPQTGGIRVSADLSGEALGWLDGEVQSLRVLARARHRDGDWQGQVQPQRLVLADGPVPAPGPIAFARSADRQWRVALSDAPLAPMASLLGDRLDRPVEVAGRAERATLVWREPSNWRLSADLSAAGLTDVSTGPDIDGASLRVEAGPRGGRVEVDRLRMRWRGDPADPMIRQPPAIDGIATTLQWWRSPQGRWRLELVDGQGQAGGTPIRFDGRMDVGAGEPPFVDLNAAVGRVDAARALQWLPVGIMDERLVDWLDRAVESGAMRAASLRWFGRPDRFPGNDGGSLFDLRARVDDVEFRFQRDWPRFEALGGELRFRNRSMQISVDSGRIGSTALQQATARIDDLASPRLRINGRLAGPLAGMQAVLQRSPLMPSQQRLERLQWRGDGDLALDLLFPFEGRPMTLEGRLRLTGADLSVTDPALALDDIRGEVTFDRQGVASSGVRARLADRPIVATAETRGEGDEARIRVSANTRLALADWPGMAPVAGRADGVAAWQLRWEQPGFVAMERQTTGERRLTVRSSLEGIALRLPAGLAKQADALAPLRLEWSDTGTSQWRLDYDDRLQAVMQQDRAALHFGDTPPSLPERPSTRLSGALPVVDLTELAGAAGGQTQGIGLPTPIRVDLALAGLDVSRWRVGAMNLAGWLRPDDWSLAATGAAQGMIQRPGPQAPWVLRLDRLDVRPRSTEASAEATSHGSSGSAPPLPATDIDLVAEQLHVAGERLGRLQLSQVNADAAAGRARLRLDGEWVDLQAQVDRTPDGVADSELRFDLYTRDAGQLLRALGLPGAMERGDGTLSGDLRWQGAMLQPAIPSLAGNLQIDLRNGSLPAVDPGAGRALGLFSLSVLPRRLGLDFSDVVGEGLSYDRLQGTWQVDAGRMYTDDLSLTGPSMDLSVRGETDLVRRRYDQRVTVTPQLSSALAFIGGLAGGPAAAALLFVTRGMLESGVEQLTDFTYHIGGTWEAPEFDLVSPNLTGGNDE
ncbi:YhdP family protein [Spiribacter vilamensis]|uniref:Uncharacterized protein (TIGR02099 family) n=1 Tax=Spiribacter vilamensis TaxID=531306 RepID=A0A4Q8CXZ4_9GAMM|nr:YhdP family protein [Spiribacter vilamensis]RZU97828.1 uncharacterized protein (TIGR02099 family) [Spiribacter vilamensis]TVO61248.1 TIGR02099 family protein [Spiribacter vilamensis]